MIAGRGLHATRQKAARAPDGSPGLGPHVVFIQLTVQRGACGLGDRVDALDDLCGFLFCSLDLRSLIHGRGSARTLDLTE